MRRSLTLLICLAGVIAGTALVTTQGCPADPHWVDQQYDVTPDIYVDDTEITEGEALIVRGEAEYGLDPADASHELTLTETIAGSEVQITGVVTYQEDENYVYDDDDGTSFIEATFSIEGLTAGEWLVWSIESDCGDLEPGNDHFGNCYRVTVLPAD